MDKGGCQGRNLELLNLQASIFQVNRDLFSFPPSGDSKLFSVFSFLLRFSVVLDVAK